jgi:hypothetical protein
MILETSLNYNMDEDYPNFDCEIIENLRSEIRELQSHNRRMYYFLDELRYDIEYEHGLNSKCYEKIKKFFDEK